VDTVERILREHPFFRGFEESHMETILSCGASVRFDAGQFLYREGEKANTFYLIRSGRVALETHIPEQGTIVFQTIGEDEIVGWAWLFPPFLWHTDARAIETVRAIAMNGICLRAKCEEDHELGYEMMKRFAQIIIQRLRASRLQLLDIYGTHMGTGGRT